MLLRNNLLQFLKRLLNVDFSFSKEKEKFCFATEMVAFVFMLVIFLSLLVCIQSLFPLFSKTPELVVSETVIEGVRGVPAHLQSKYIGESFVCDDSTHTYSINELNDGYV